MPEFLAQYSYDDPQFASIVVEADSLAAAEHVALNELRDILGPDVFALTIESVEEIKNA